VWLQYGQHEIVEDGVFVFFDGKASGDWKGVMQTVKKCCSMWTRYQISLWPYHHTYVGRGVLDPTHSVLLLQSRALIIQDLAKSYIWAIAPKPPV
jgi:hypothetical protein